MTNQGQYKIITNQEQYDLMWEKAKKYDRLVGVLDKIRAEIEEHRRKTESIDSYDLVGDCLDIIDKYKESENKE